MTASSSKENLRPDNQGYDDEKGIPYPTPSPLERKMACLSLTIVSIAIVCWIMFGAFVLRKIHDGQAPDSDWMITAFADSVFAIFMTALWGLEFSFILMAMTIEYYAYDTGFEESRVGLGECKMIAYWVFLPSLVVFLVSTVVLLSI